MHSDKIVCIRFWIYLWKNHKKSLENINSEVINLEISMTKYTSFRHIN